MVISVIPLLVCDDSAMARKQLIRALPPEWPVSITQASQGEEAMAAIRQGLGEVVLLDLTMPVMDGYQVLAQVREEGHAVMASRQIRGVTNVACPVLGSNGQVIAALNVPHIERIDQQASVPLAEVKLQVASIAARISALMGYTASP